MFTGLKALGMASFIAVFVMVLSAKTTTERRRAIFLSVLYLIALFLFFMVMVIMFPEWTTWP